MCPIYKKMSITTDILNDEYDDDFLNKAKDMVDDWQQNYQQIVTNLYEGNEAVNHMNDKVNSNTTVQETQTPFASIKGRKEIFQMKS